MLGINLSTQIYHQFFSLGFKFKENNENDMTFVVWASTVFGPRVWPLSARRHYVLRGLLFQSDFVDLILVWASFKEI